MVRGSDLGCTLRGQGKGPRVLNSGRTGSDLASCLRPLCRDRLKLLGQVTCMLMTGVILGSQVLSLATEPVSKALFPEDWACGGPLQGHISGSFWFGGRGRVGEDGRVILFVKPHRPS